ncbi:Tyrosine permease [Limosilactobacillus gastricus PS3]|uniref:Tyrosine permease n=1 Tax=Limosilactobacillus gastricus PS3 TaxID=1144300 RepID=H4GJZ9_9LACO|nr:Tyrosine permease [Limosilactobacillus gastricus PS3]
MWVQMFPAMVMIASTLGPLLGNTIDNRALGQNHWFTLICILVFYWLVTILNLKFDMAKLGGAVGIWLGVYLPISFMILTGFLAFLKLGISPTSILGSFKPSKLVPDLSDYQSLKYISAVVFIFTGISTTGVYAPRLKNLTKTFTRGLSIAVLVIVLMNFFNSFLIANAIPHGQAELTDITQPVIIYCQILHWPSWIVQIFSGFAFIGVLVQLSTWVTAPSQTIIEVANDGLLPPKWGWYRHNQYGVSKNIVLTQAIAITLFALLYALPNINSVFLMLVNTAVFLYCMVYIIIAIAYLILRYQYHGERPFNVDRHGNSRAWLVAILLILGIIICFISTIITTKVLDSVIMISISILLFVIPLIVERYKKPSWLNDLHRNY